MADDKARTIVRNFDFLIVEMNEMLPSWQDAQHLIRPSRLGRRGLSTGGRLDRRFDSTASESSRILAFAMQAGMIPKSLVWLLYRIPDSDPGAFLNKNDRVAAWLQQFSTVVWLMLNRSSVLESAIDDSDTELKDALGVKKTERKPIYASPLARGFALFIDLAMTAPIVLMLRTVVGFELEHAYSFLNVGSAMLSDESLIVILRATLVTLLVLTIYSSICEFYWGKTLGKALLRLRIESMDGEPPAPWQLLVRNIVKIFELAHYILILIPLAFMMMSTKQQRLGDYLGKTVVVLDVVPEEQADDLDV